MTAKLRVLDLFSGIGGFSLGLESTGGFETIGFCEVDPYARRVLTKHWPGVPVYDDIRNLNGASVGAVDVVCGGFPCQDISLAGSGAGLAGDRSGLWYEMLRVIGEARPAFVIVENVAALRSRGLDEVLRGVASLGYDAEWHCIPASAVGAWHKRDRLWIVAYPQGIREWRGLREEGPFNNGAIPSDCGADVANPQSIGLAERQGIAGYGGEEQPPIVRGCSDAAEWPPEPDVGRVANGIPARVDRLRCLGNAVVPQIPDLLGRAILAALAPSAA